MNHFASPKFWECYNKLPENIRELADKKYKLLKSDPSHPSLHFKKTEQYWSVRIGIKYRSLAVETSKNLIWFWIGTHADYDKLLKEN